MEELIGGCVIWNNPSLSLKDLKIIIHIKRELFGFGDKVSCTPGWAQTCYTAKTTIELLIFFHHFPIAGIIVMHHYT